jgi:hypothetical protein
VLSLISTPIITLGGLGFPLIAAGLTKGLTHKTVSLYVPMCAHIRKGGGGDQDLDKFTTIKRFLPAICPNLKCTEAFKKFSFITKY